MQHSFIEAEVVLCEDRVSLGSMNEAKGKLRLEGKDYLVKDGDDMHVQFNI